MAGGNPIKLFQFNQRYCQTIGIKMPQSNPNSYKFNSIHLIFTICLAQLVMASATFMLNGAKSMGEYGLSFVTVICSVESMFVYLYTTWKWQDFLKFTEKCEALIKTSKLNFFHKEIAFCFVCKS